MEKSKGTRYSDEKQLNYTKVLAVLIALVVIVVFVITLKKLLTVDLRQMSGNEFFALYKDEKWGVIDNKGNIIIDPSYAEMLVIPDNEKDVFICNYDIDNKTGEYKTKVLNKKNKTIFTEYEQVEALENYDEGQNVWYEKNVLKVRKDGKYGLINFKGINILECEYDDIYTLKGIENSIIIEKDSKLGLVDDTGRIIIDSEYSEILPVGTESGHGYITIDSQGKYGVISYSKEQVLENKYEYIEQMYGKNYYVVKENKKQKVINYKGEDILITGYDEIKAILQKQPQGVIFIKDNKYGVMEFTGKVLIQPQYTKIKELSNGYLVAEKDGKSGIIDTLNNILLPFDYLTIDYNKKADLYIAEDIENKISIVDTDFSVKLIGILSEFNFDKNYIRMRVDSEYKYYTMKCEETTNVKALRGNTLFLSQKDGKYGYVDAKGEKVVDYIYDDATEQNRFGYVAVKKNGLWGSLDDKGNVVVEPKYKLEENLIINFIDKWHLGEDLNMNYYCEK